MQGDWRDGLVKSQPPRLVTGPALGLRPGGLRGLLEIGLGLGIACNFAAAPPAVCRGLLILWHASGKCEALPIAARLPEPLVSARDGYRSARDCYRSARR